MLPPVIDEGEFFPFKFWFQGSIQDGMYYRNELFYRLHTVDINHRARLYHYACRLSLRDEIVVTATDTTCSIWVSLRSPGASNLRPGDPFFPPLMEPVPDEKGE